MSGKGKFTDFFWTAPDQGLERIVDKSDLNHEYFRKDSHASRNLRQFIENELGYHESGGTGQEPPHIGLMREHELVDYCDASEKGHMKWYPKGVLMMQLLTEYARDLALDWGAFEMMNPMLIRGDQNDVGELMGEFHERDYKVDGGRGIGFLRYASDPLAFPFMQKIRMSHHQTPLKVYEQANCFRNEQDGEVSGLKRMRWFIMSDMHAACDSKDQAMQEYETLTRRFSSLMNDVLAPGRWVLGWEITQDAFDEHGEWLTGLSRDIEAPAFFKVMPEMSHYYAFKNEYQSIISDGSNVQISTVQWDVKNGERFNIGYVNEQGEKTPFPYIIHASSIGSVERAMCSVLENIAIDESEGKVPEFPLWLSPTQARVVPVSDDHVEYASNLAKTLSEYNIRADVDDRNRSVGKSIRDAEQEWVPYVLVVGDREIEEDTLSVRRRSTRDQYSTGVDGLVDEITSKTKEFPYLPLSLPAQLSRRPSFI